MTDATKTSLVGRYYAYEKLTLVVALLSIFRTVFELDDTINLPVLNLRLREPGHLLVVSTTVLLLCLTFTSIEWKQSSRDARRHALSRLRFGLTLGVALAALWMSLPALTAGTSLAGVSRSWYVAYVFLGLGVGELLSVLALSTLMIQSKEEALKVGLPRVPVATRCQYLVWSPVLAVLLLAYFLANHYAPVPLLMVAPFLTGLPAVLLLLSLAKRLFFGRDETGKRVQYRTVVSRLKEIHSMHDYFYLLSARRPSIIPPASASPAALQQSIREHFADDSGTVGLRTQTLEEFHIEFYAKDGNAENRTPENRGVRIEVSSRSAKGLRVRVWPKEKKNAPRWSRELVLRREMLERHGENFVSERGDCEFTEGDLARYMIDESVKETLQEQVQSPLLAAASCGRQDLVEELVAGGQDVNERTAYGWTPLLMASAHGYPEMAKYLLEKGANPDISNVHGITPLMYAARYGNVPIARLLIEFGASLDVQDVYGDTALAVATRTGHEEVVRLLLEKGADREIGNRRGEKPLDQAYRVGYGNIARLLHARQGDPSSSA